VVGRRAIPIHPQLAGNVPQRVERRDRIGAAEGSFPHRRVRPTIVMRLITDT
jgi:hypothetical protein